MPTGTDTALNVQTGEVTTRNYEIPAALTDAQRAARITLKRTTMEPVLVAALQAAGASVTLVTIGSYIDGALAASTDLSDDEKEIGRWLFKSATTFQRGDPEVVIKDPDTDEPLLTAAELLEKCAAVLGFGAGALGESPTWAERVAAAKPALDTLFLLAEAQQ